MGNRSASHRLWLTHICSCCFSLRYHQKNNRYSTIYLLLCLSNHADLLSSAEHRIKSWMLRTKQQNHIDLLRKLKHKMSTLCSAEEINDWTTWGRVYDDVRMLIFGWTVPVSSECEHVMTPGSRPHWIQNSASSASFTYKWVFKHQTDNNNTTTSTVTHFRQRGSPEVRWQRCLTISRHRL